MYIICMNCNYVSLAFWTLQSYILATSKIIAIGDCAHSWRLGDKAILTMIWYPTQSHYPNTELTNLYPSLVMLNIILGGNKSQFCELSEIWTRNLSDRKLSIIWVGHCRRWSVYGGRMLLSWYCVGDSLGPKCSDRCRAVVHLWRWSVRQVLLYTYTHVVVQ